jgi:hypothetical protein
MSDPIFATDQFYTHAGTVYVPTHPEGTIEMRLDGDIARIKRYRYIRDMALGGVPNENRLVAEMNIPLSALIELLKP